MQDLFAEHIDRIVPEAVQFRRELHAHPELSFQERETAGRIRARLQQIANIQAGTHDSSWVDKQLRDLKCEGLD